MDYIALGGTVREFGVSIRVHVVVMRNANRLHIAAYLNTCYEITLTYRNK